jgi:hypothetical protein
MDITRRFLGLVYHGLGCVGYASYHVASARVTYLGYHTRAQDAVSRPVADSWTVSDVVVVGGF